MVVGYIEINKLLFADDTAQQTGEYVGRVCKRRKLRVNVGKSNFFSCSRYVNVGQMHVTLNGEPLEEVDCFKYMLSEVAADGSCERDVVQNE